MDPFGTINDKVGPIITGKKAEAVRVATITLHNTLNTDDTIAVALHEFGHLHKMNDCNGWLCTCGDTVMYACDLSVQPESLQPCDLFFYSMYGQYGT
jgi:hypothetical protein